MDIKVTQRNVYGNELLYPANKAAETLAKIAGTKTLSHEVLGLAQQLGLHISMVAPAMPTFPTTARSPG